ncbi:hypothetical protein [Methylogaea oryzae]|nr:hypothetical protein [Methylogaea oryzae]
MGMRIPSSNMVQTNGSGAWQQRRESFNQLASALQSGDLKSAQQAFSTLTPNSTAATDPNSPLAKLGKALQSGDINAAQQAFSTLRSGGRHHHHHQQPSDTSASVSTNTAAGTTDTVGTKINLTA